MEIIGIIRSIKCLFIPRIFIKMPHIITVVFCNNNPDTDWFYFVQSVSLRSEAYQERLKIISQFDLIGKFMRSKGSTSGCFLSLPTFKKIYGRGVLTPFILFGVFRFEKCFFGRKGRFLRLFLTQYFWQRFLETLKNRVKAFLFSVHISYGKGKYLNQTVLFYKFAKT